MFVKLCLLDRRFYSSLTLRFVQRTSACSYKTMNILWYQSDKRYINKPTLFTYSPSNRTGLLHVSAQTISYYKLFFFRNLVSELLSCREWGRWGWLLRPTPKKRLQMQHKLSTKRTERLQMQHKLSTKQTERLQMQHKLSTTQTERLQMQHKLSTKRTERLHMQHKLFKKKKNGQKRLYMQCQISAQKERKDCRCSILTWPARRGRWDLQLKVHWQRYPYVFPCSLCADLLLPGDRTDPLCWHIP